MQKPVPVSIINTDLMCTCRCPYPSEQFHLSSGVALHTYISMSTFLLHELVPCKTAEVRLKAVHCEHMHIL